MSRLVAERNGLKVLRIHEFGQLAQGLESREAISYKIRDLYKEAAKHDVLFADEMQGDVEHFVTLFMNPRSIWLEIADEEGNPVGTLYATDVIPGYDADVHVTFWDSKASGREDLVRDTLRWLFEKWDLSRVTAEIPGYQRGTIRFTSRCGFVREGEKRRADKYKGRWFGTVIMGFTRDDLEEYYGSED